MENELENGTETPAPALEYLNLAMTEIEEILKKYDLGAVVILGNQTHMTSRLAFPSWSLVQSPRESNNNHILMCKYRHAEDTMETLERSVGMAANFREASREFGDAINNFMLKLGERLDITEMSLSHAPSVPESEVN